MSAEPVYVAANAPFRTIVVITLCIYAIAVAALVRGPNSLIFDIALEQGFGPRHAGLLAASLITLAFSAYFFYLGAGGLYFKRFPFDAALLAARAKQHCGPKAIGLSVAALVASALLIFQPIALYREVKEVRNVMADFQR